jgi:glycosyltransferase involved in cell wall biosynthesis
VHCHSSLVSPLAWSFARAAAATGRTAVVTMHSVVPTSGPLAAPLRLASASIGDGVVWTAVSAVACTALESIVQRRVDLLHNGVDVTGWRRSAAGAHAVPTVVAVMRLVRRKRPLPLVDVLASVDRRLGPDVAWRAVVAGDGPQTAAVARAVRRAGLASRVQLAGRLDRLQVKQLLAGADVFAAPAYLESFGIAALEARCAAVPVVAMRGAGVQEFLVDGEDGVLVDDDDAMGERIAGLLADPAQLRAMSARAAARPVQQSWPVVVQRCHELYAAAARQSVARPPAVELAL